MKKDIKRFVRKNKPAKLNGGYFEGKEMFLPAEHEGDLRMPIPTDPPLKVGYHNSPTRRSLKIAIYRQTKYRHNWQYAGLD